MSYEAVADIERDIIFIEELLRKVSVPPKNLSDIDMLSFASHETVYNGEGKRVKTTVKSYDKMLLLNVLCKLRVKLNVKQLEPPKIIDVRATFE